MADSDISSKKKISELRVIDLRNELEKRGLDRSGVKTSLVERLGKALQDEGQNPEDFLFDMTSDSTKTPIKSPIVKRASRKTKDSEGDATQEETNTEDDDEKMDEAHSVTKELDKEEGGESKDEVITPETKKHEECNGKKESEIDKQHEPTMDTTKLKERDSKATPQFSNNASLLVETSTEKTDTVQDSAVTAADSSVVEKVAVMKKELDSTGKEDDRVDAEPKEDETTSKDIKDQDSEISNKPNESETPKTVAQKTKSDEDATQKSKECRSSESATAVKSPVSPTKSTKGAGEKVKRVAGNGQNLWVSGLASKTKAIDLKVLFSKHGKVLASKIVTNARSPGGHRYGLITMASSKDATACIQHLQKSELHGRMITVETTSRETVSTSKRSEKASTLTSTSGQAKTLPQKRTPERKRSVSKDDNTETDKTDGNKEETKPASEKGDKDDKEIKSENGENKKNDEVSQEDKTLKDSKDRKRTISRDRAPRLRDTSYERRRNRRTRSRSRSRERFSNYSRPRGHFTRGRGFNRGGFAPFRPYNNRFHNPMGERSPERRPFYDSFRHDDIERKNRDEYIRLKREGERLRAAREELERERAEVLRLEREKQREERDKLERERAELRRRSQTIHLDERRGTKRVFESRAKEDDPVWDDRKRVAGGSPPPRYVEMRGDRSNYPERRPDRFDRSKPAAPEFSGRRDAMERDKRPFSRDSRTSQDVPDRRPREDWKTGKPREGSFERGRGATRPAFLGNERGNPGFERPNPWGNEAARGNNRFGPESGSTGQWGPVGKTENWSRMDAPIQERWGNIDPVRNAPAMGIGHHPQNAPHPNPMEMFGGANQLMHNIPGNFAGDRFNVNNIRQF